MAEVLRRPSPTPSFFIPLLEKVERMKLGAPTVGIAGKLEGMENRAKTYHWFWVANERKVRGLMRNRLEWRIHALFITIASAAVVVMGCERAGPWIKYYKKKSRSMQPGCSTPHS